MGGFGSGRKPGTARHVEDFAALDVLWLHRGGWLEAGASGVLRWHRGGDSIGLSAQLSVLYVLEAEVDLEVAVTYRPGVEPARELLHVEWSPCRFGGRRPWFRCWCDRLVLRLYLGGEPWFRCRRCCRLSYASQSETTTLRAMRRARKLRDRLGIGWAGNVERPVGMRWRKFARLAEALEAADAEWSSALLGARYR